MPIVPCKPGQYGNTYNTDQFWIPYYPPEKVRYTEPTPFLFSVGVDLGSVNDATAITILEVQRGYEVTEAFPHNAAPFEIKREDDLHFLVRLVHRPRLGTPYSQIIEQVASIMEDLPRLPQRPVLVWDATGLGFPVVQNARLRDDLRHSIGLVITAGQTASMTGRDWTVPKGYLVGETRLAMHRKRLHVAQGFRDRETLQTELEQFTAKLSASGRATFNAAGEFHDDTVLSLSMAIVAAKNWFANGISLVRFTGF